MVFWPQVSGMKRALTRAFRGSGIIDAQKVDVATLHVKIKTEGINTLHS